MADRVADLVVRLKADTAQLDRELKKTETKVEATSRRISSAFSALRPGLIAAGAAIAGGAAALGLMARRALETADDLGKAADRIGVTTESLQRLSFAADLAGVSQAQFEKGLETFVRRMGEAAGGTGALISGLEKLNPQLLSNISKAKSTEQAFLLVADAVAATTDPAKRAALAYAAFGRSGIALVNTLVQGSDAIRAQGDELERYAGLLSREAAQAAEDFNDSLTELSTFMSGRFLTSFVDAEGGVSDLTDILRDPEVRQGVSDLAAAAGTLARQIAEIGASALGAVSKIAEWREEMRAALDELPRGTEFFIRLNPFARPLLAGIRAGADEEASGIDPELQRQQLEALGFGPRRQSASPAQPASLSGFDTSDADGSKGAASKAAREAEKLLRERERAEEQAQKRLTEILVRGVEERLQIAGREADLIGLRATAELAQLDELSRIIPEQESKIQDARVTVVRNALEEIAKLEDEAAEERAKAAADLAKEQREEFVRSFDGVRQVISQTIGGLLLQQERDWDAFFRSLVASFVSTGVDKILEQLVNGLAGSSAASGASGGGGGFVGSLLGIVGGLLFAKGGVVSRPTLGVVGEAGPEAVIPLDRLDRMLASQQSGVTVNIIGAPEGTEVKRSKSADGTEQIDAFIGGSMARNMQRGFQRQRFAPGVIGG